MAALVATLGGRFPPPGGWGGPLLDEDEAPSVDDDADMRWLADTPPGCGLLRRSSGMMAMAVAAVANGALTCLLLTPRLVFKSLALVVLTQVVGRGCLWCCW